MDHHQAINNNTNDDNLSKRLSDTSDEISTLDLNLNR